MDGTRGTDRPGHGGRWVALSLGWLALAATACGIFGGGKSAAAGGGDGRQISLTLTAEDKLNTCGGDGPANALGVRVYQLGSDRGMSSVPQAALWEDDAKELGPELIDRQEYFLDPGATQTVKLRLKPQSRALAVVGNFCSSEGTCWKWVRSVEGMRSEIGLRFGETCLEAAP